MTSQFKGTTNGSRPNKKSRQIDVEKKRKVVKRVEGRSMRHCRQTKVTNMLSVLLGPHHMTQGLT